MANRINKAKLVRGIALKLTGEYPDEQKTAEGVELVGMLERRSPRFLLPMLSLMITNDVTSRQSRENTRIVRGMLAERAEAEAAAEASEARADAAAAAAELTEALYAAAGR